MQRGYWPGEKSRMSREAPVRFCEGLGMKFPRATQLMPGHHEMMEWLLKQTIDLVRIIEDSLKKAEVTRKGQEVQAAVRVKVSAGQAALPGIPFVYVCAKAISTFFDALHNIFTSHKGTRDQV